MMHVLVLFSVPGNDSICNNYRDWRPDKVTFNDEYKAIDFKDIVANPNPENSTFNGIIVKLKNKNSNDKIMHTLPKINRCCQIGATEKVQYDGIDNVMKDSCDISEWEFIDKYVRRRNPVLLSGCQDTWAARNWTFRGNTSFSMLVLFEL